MQSMMAELIELGQQTQAGKLVFHSEREGDCILLISGVRSIIRVNGRQYYMQPFTFLLHPVENGKLQTETQGITAMRYMHLNFPELYRKRLADDGLLMQEMHTLANPIAVEEIWKLLVAASDTKTPLAYETRVHALELMLCMLRQSSDGTVARAAEIPHYDKLTMLRHQIYLHPEENWQIQEICRKIGISRPYFHKLYLLAFGTTCTQDVIESRIACAKRLLETTGDAVSSIAQQSGFETDVYFMRQFKRHVGMTPTAYRRIYRQSASHGK